MQELNGGGYWKMRKPNWRKWLKDKEDCKFWLDRYIGNKVLQKKKDESQLYLRKTDHNLNFANWILEKHQDEIPEVFGDEAFYDWVVSIYYYAIYHAALSLISSDEYSSKNHSATLCFVIYHHYHLKKTLKEEDVELVADSLKKEDIEILGSSKELRERASYNVHEDFEKKLAEESREQAVEFVNKIKSLLEESNK